MEIILFQHSVLGGCFQAGKNQHAPWFFFKDYNPRETEFHYQTMQITQQPVCHWLYLDFFLHSEHFWPSAGSRQAGTCGFCPHKAWTEEGEPLVKVTARHLCALMLYWDFCMNSLGQRLKHRSQTQKFCFFCSVSDAADAQLFNTREAELESRCSLQDPAVSVAPKCSWMTPLICWECFNHSIC